MYRDPTFADEDREKLQAVICSVRAKEIRPGGMYLLLESAKKCKAK